MEKVLKKRDEVLGFLANKMGGFYLAGGTALSAFYFNHRESYDLDFFTKEFMRTRIAKIVKDISEKLRSEIEMIGEQNQKDKDRIVMYSVPVDKKNSLKIDFVEDIFPLLKSLRLVDGIYVLSKEDIYFRKILTACGSFEILDDTGKRQFKGGRQEPKDFFDLYFLSKTFIPLSKFASQYCNDSQKESIIIWYRAYDRFTMKSGLCDIKTDKKINYKDIEKHFMSEIGKMIEEEIR
ncbi:MAG: nucleotidyl transferase AbiEii/AbiGii toxin family protein [Candidatus Omnitrophota bacterium]